MGWAIALDIFMLAAAAAIVWRGRILVRMDRESHESPESGAPAMSVSQPPVAELGRREPSVKASSEAEGEGPLVSPPGARLDVDDLPFEVFELRRIPSSGSLPDKLEQHTFGRYPSEFVARLKVEAIRQQYRESGDHVYRWLIVRDATADALALVVEGVFGLESVERQFAGGFSTGSGTMAPQPAHV